MRRVTDYNIVTGRVALPFFTEVKRLIDQGWQPLGGPTSTNPSQLAQAMVKYEEAAQDVPPSPSPRPSKGGTADS